jgi:hypothetical protein
MPQPTLIQNNTTVNMDPASPEMQALRARYEAAKEAQALMRGMEEAEKLGQEEHERDD